MVAPNGRNGWAGSSRLNSSADAPPRVEVLRERQPCARASPCTSRSTMDSARAAQTGSPVTSAAARNASTVCMLALAPR